MSLNTKVIKYLNELLKHTLDAVKMYKDAARNITDQELKNFFIERAKEKLLLEEALKAEIKGLKGKAIEAGSFMNIFQRSWTNFKTSLDHNNVKEICDFCISEERKAIKEYGIILRNEKLVSDKFYSILEIQNEKNLKSIEALLEKMEKS
ncbi:MAG: PA2169 family four-helix-bundle protein [Cyclobacteriaceae bacterium]